MFGYVNGKIVPVRDMRVSARDLGFLRGYAVFDYMFTMKGKPFLFEEHWNRLEMSAKMFDLRMPTPREEAYEIIQELWKMSDISDDRAVVRTMLTGGVSADGLTPEIGKETFCVMLEKFHGLDPALYETGAKLITLEHKRAIAHVKSSNYVFPILHGADRKKAKAVEMLYVSDGKVLEASVSNFFLVKKRVLITPKEEVLRGITRNHVVYLAKQNDILCEERDILVEELSDCDEAFITSSSKDILPITTVNDQVIADGNVGSVTKKLMEVFRESILK